MSILITALGNNDLKETHYAYRDKRHFTRFCCLALCRILPNSPSQMLVLLTQEAKAKHEEQLKNEAKKLGIGVIQQAIPTAKSVNEVWETFDGLVTRLSVGFDCPEIFLDITNAFRHLPLVFFSSLAFLDGSGKASLKGIYYGAYDATREDITPVFDLTPLVSLFKGTYAIKAFEETGP